MNKKTRAIPAATFVLAILVGPTAPVASAENCLPSADFWSSLEAGFNPLPDVIPAPVTGWIRESLLIRFVASLNGETSTVRGEDIGFAIFSAADQPPGSPAVIWGTPERVRGFVTNSGETEHITSYAAEGGALLCVGTEAAELGGDPFAEAPPTTVPMAVCIPLPCIVGDPETDPTLCAPANKMWYCLVAESDFCDTLGLQPAFDKMATMAFAAWAAYDSQTAANDWGGAWLKCYLETDPFNHSLQDPEQVLVDFKAREYHKPTIPRTIMAYVQSYLMVGMGDCAGNYFLTPVYLNAATAEVEKDIFLHESGHVTDASHEPGYTGTAPCAGGVPHAGWLLNGKNSIMSFRQGIIKDRIFTDGGFVNADPNRNNVCVINANIAIRMSDPSLACA